MSTSAFRSTKVSVGPNAPLVSGVNLVSARSAYSAITGLGAISADLVFLGVNQGGSGNAYSSIVGNTIAGQYLGTTTAPTAASIVYQSNDLAVTGASTVTLTTTSGGGRVNVAKDLNAQANVVFGNYSTSDKATVTKGTFTTAPTLTLPEITGTFVMDAGTQTIGGSKTFSSPVVVPNPTLSTHAATKDYVDSVATGLDFKNSVRVVEVNNLALTGSSPLVIDGVTTATADRVLLVGQTTASQNGIYDVTISGGSYTLARSADANTSAEVTSGLYTYVEEGSTGGGFAYVLATPNPIVLDTTALTFVVFNAPNVYTAGNGLTLTSGQFAVASTISTNTFDAATAVQTNSITTHSGSNIAFNSKNLTGIATATATGAVTAADVVLLNDTNQIALGSDVTNKLYINAPTSGLSQATTYSFPITGASTAVIPVVSGVTAPGTGYVLASTANSSVGQWLPSVPVSGTTGTANTSSTSTTAIITKSTATGTYYLFKAWVVAKDTTASNIATYELSVGVKNVSGTLTLGDTMYSSTSYDATFSGNEVSFSTSGTNVLLNVTPSSTNSISWFAQMNNFSV